MRSLKVEAKTAELRNSDRTGMVKQPLPLEISLAMGKRVLKWSRHGDDVGPNVENYRESALKV